MTAFHRLKSDFGTFRSACEWYGKELRLSKAAAAKEMGVSTSRLYQLLDQYGCRDCFLPIRDQRSSGKGIPRKGAGNAKLSRRPPLTYKGRVYHPGEPTHHYLWQTVNKRQRRKLR